MREFLLEILSEDIPARMQVQAADDLKRLVTESLTTAGLSYAKATAHSTPRRLVLVIEGLPETSPDRTEERKGPKVGAPEGAIQGFLKSAGLTSNSAGTSVIGSPWTRPPAGCLWAARWFWCWRPGKPLLSVLSSSLPSQKPAPPNWPPNWHLAPAGPWPAWVWLSPERP